MKWIVKALLQKALSGVPGGHRLNYLFQTRVFRRLPVPDQRFGERMLYAIRDRERLMNSGLEGDPSTWRTYEFGAGWDLATQIARYAVGFDHQTLIDIRPLLRYELINHTIARLRANRTRYEELYGHRLRPLPLTQVRSAADLEAFGIHYRAPVDAADTGFATGSFDLVLNYLTFEHIPERDVLPILKECRRVLKDSGMMMCSVDTSDHYSYFDPSISCYNYLRWPDWLWWWLNSSLHHQNRMRCPDYLDAMAEAGFAVVRQWNEIASPQDIELLQTMRLAPRFTGRYEPEDLGIKHFLVILRPVEAMATAAAAEPAHGVAKLDLASWAHL